jgi:Ser/Thr protein kinase RdoA (MazF antagonist)
MIARRKEAAEGNTLAKEVAAALEALVDSLQLFPPCLVHDDYFPGNTVWRQGRLVGIVDWTSAVLGDPRMDVGQCRLDLVVSHGIDLADRLLADYESASGRPLPDFWFFDLFYGLSALLYYKDWLVGYNDAGITHLRPEDVYGRLHAFVTRALDEGQRVQVGPVAPRGAHVD